MNRMAGHPLTIQHERNIMRFTLIAAAAATIMALAGASAFFIPAFLAVGIAIDSNERKNQAA